jgi:cysteine synthase
MTDPLVEVDQQGHADRPWVVAAIRKLQRDQNRTADTHLHAVKIPALPTVDLYLKDESTHPTGSLKHRVARARGGDARGRGRF